jgi:hypothetical protein
MILSALALLALVPEEKKFTCRTELPGGATKAVYAKGAPLSGSYYPTGDERTAFNYDETVEACVEIDVNGRVNSCSAQGSDDFISTYTCKIISRRFQYEPARNRKKRPISSFLTQKVIWKRPE